jgi:large subunit ribosomal protein L23
MEFYKIIKKPLITEKVSKLKTNKSIYVFAVDIKANKIEIRQAVEKIFNVPVEKVNTVLMAGKRKGLGLRTGVMPNWKKAYVTLKKGSKIQQFEV